MYAIRSYYEIEIKPQESGIITEIYVEEGDMVKSGDIIAKLRIIPEVVQVNNAEAQLRRAKIAATNAEIEFKRNQKLYDEKVIRITSYNVCYTKLLRSLALIQKLRLKKKNFWLSTLALSKENLA